MTTPDDAKKIESDKPDEDLELSKETLEDLDTPEEAAEAARGGVPPTNACPTYFC